MISPSYYHSVAMQTTSHGRMHSGQHVDRYSLLPLLQLPRTIMWEKVCAPFPMPPNHADHHYTTVYHFLSVWWKYDIGCWQQFWWILPTFLNIIQLNFTYHGLIWVFKFWHHHYCMPFVTSMASYMITIVLPEWSMLCLINQWCKPFWYNTDHHKTMPGAKASHGKPCIEPLISREEGLCKLVNNQTSSSYLCSCVGCNPLLFDLKDTAMHVSPFSCGGQGNKVLFFHFTFILQNVTTCSFLFSCQKSVSHNHIPTWKFTEGRKMWGIPLL